MVARVWVCERVFVCARALRMSVCLSGVCLSVCGQIDGEGWAVTVPGMFYSPSVTPHLWRDENRRGDRG